MSLLFDPFDDDFFGRALLAAVLVGAITGALGPFVIVRRMAYIGQGLSQVAVISANRDRSLNISNLLFGNILGVDRNDLILVAAVGLPNRFRHSRAAP